MLRAHNDTDRHSQIPALIALARTVEAKEPGRAGHGERTAFYATALGRAVDLTEPELSDLHHASRLHNIGKLFLPTDLLWKQGPLSPDEYASLQSHPRLGAALLEPIPPLRRAALWIAHHHERWDGCGYPYGLRGELIPFGSRILSVADTFDALLTSTAVGHPGDFRTAIALIEVLAGSQLDPILVRTFSSLVLDAGPRLAQARDVLFPQPSPEWSRALHSSGREALVPPGLPAHLSSSSGQEAQRDRPMVHTTWAGSRRHHGTDHESTLTNAQIQPPQLAKHEPMDRSKGWD